MARPFARYDEIREWSLRGEAIPGFRAVARAKARKRAGGALNPGYKFLRTEVGCRDPDPGRTEDHDEQHRQKE
jgi:hypothetical protein